MRRKQLLETLCMTNYIQFKAWSYSLIASCNFFVKSHRQRHQLKTIPILYVPQSTEHCVQACCYVYPSLCHLCHQAVWRFMPFMAFLPPSATHAGRAEPVGHLTPPPAMLGPWRFVWTYHGQSHLGGFSKPRLHREASVCSFFPK